MDSAVVLDSVYLNVSRRKLISNILSNSLCRFVINVYPSIPLYRLGYFISDVVEEPQDFPGAEIQPISSFLKQAGNGWNVG